jgi:chemotaxis regulatin CheY-phosphate phosphatase CheZ
MATKNAPAKPATKSATKSATKPAAKPATKPATPASPAKKTAVRKPAAKPAGRKTAKAADVLSELRELARELNKTAKGLNTKKGAGNPREVSSILGSVERMTAEAATKSLYEAENAKHIVVKLTDSLGKDWNRKEIEAALKLVGGHLTNIIVAQEFQDLAGQSIRKAMKALVGAIIVTEGGGTAEEGRLSQTEIDSLLQDLIP